MLEGNDQAHRKGHKISSSSHIPFNRHAIHRRIGNLIPSSARQFKLLKEHRTQEILWHEMQNILCARSTESEGEEPSDVGKGPSNGD